MSDEKDDRGLLRFIDPRMPLPWLIAVIVAASSVYFKVQALTEEIISLRIEVKAGNQSWATLAGEQALQKFRQSNTEDEVKGLKAAVSALQQGRSGR